MPPRKRKVEQADPVVSDTAASKGATAKGKGASKKQKLQPEAPKEETVADAKCTAPVDAQCPVAATTHVYSDCNDIWDCMLNQTEIDFNNNKYFVIQLLKDNKTPTYYVWTRWGRVGLKGQSKLVHCATDLVKAIKTFCKKFREKSRNDWYKRANFVKQEFYYDLLKMDYSPADKDTVDSATTSADLKEMPASTLDQRVQDLIALISDVKAMEDVVVEMKFDAKKNPLGKLTKEQIRLGYSALKDIETLIQDGDFGKKLTNACNAFYSRIPHDFGMKPPDRIVSLAKVKEKMFLLVALEDIEIAVNIVVSEYQEMDKNPLDRNYLALNCTITPLEKTGKVYQILEEYFTSAHDPNHNTSWRMKLVDIFEINRDEDYSSTADNKMLLWHGSRLTNYVGILSQGLRIAPPEAPVCGYRWGKGVYFADSACKSACYCRATKSRDVGLLLLSEVKLGTSNEMTSSNPSASNLPKGKQSVKARGELEPDADNYRTISDVTVPCGKLKETGVGNQLIHNEYIVYNTNQIKLKYILKVKFNFRR